MSLSTALNAIVLIVEPSFPIRVDFICFSPTIFPFNVLRSSIANLGSGLPDPKGDSFETLLKKSKCSFS